MSRKKQAPVEESTLDKRPWLMDWLFEIGQDLAIINHCSEKIQYLQKEIANISDDYGEMDKIADEIDHYETLSENAYGGYNIKMTHVFDSIPGAKKEARCLLKHACYKITLAQETYDSQRSTIAKFNLDNAFTTFVEAVSLALGIEFKDCMRCLYDGVKTASESVSGGDSDGIVSLD